MANKDLRKGVYQEGVYPTEYQVMLTPNLENWTCHAVTTIKIIAENEINFVDLNAYNLDNILVNLGPKKNCTIEIDPDGLDRKKDRRIRIHLPHPQTGTFELLINSEAIINEKLAGLYKSLYDTGDRNRGAFATSQFEE